MDNENIAAILKDAINASTAKIQSESKHTKVFVLPPELLKGLLVKNEVPKKMDDTTTKAETSSSKNNRKTATEKRQSLENSKSTTQPVDRPKRTSNRKSTANDDLESTKLQKSSKSNLKDVKNLEQSHEQSTVFENNETSEKVTTQKKSNRGRKAKTKTESESCNAEKKEDATLDKTLEECTLEIAYEFDDCPTNATSDKPLDECSEKKCTVETSDKVEEKSTETNHELQDYSINEISSNIIPEDNLTNTETVVLNSDKKSCDETIKLDDIKTEVIDQVLEDPRIEIFQSDASQKILNGEISSHEKFNDEKSSNDKETVIIEEETFIVEEIIEIVESDEETILIEDDKVNKLKENSIQTDKVMSVENIDLSKPTNAPINIKSEPISKTCLDVFEPIVVQKRRNTARVYVNKRKQRSNDQVQERSIPHLNDNINKNNLINQKLEEKPNPEIDCNNCDDNLTTTHLTETFQEIQQPNSEIDCNYFGQHNSIDTALIEAPIEDLFEESKNSQTIPEKSNLEKESNLDENDLSIKAETETITAKQCQEIENSEVQEQSHLEIDSSLIKIESSSNQKRLPDSASTDNPSKEIKDLQISQEQSSAEISCKIDEVELDTVETESFEVNSNEEIKQEEIVSSVESDIIIDIDKTECENNISESVEPLAGNVQDSKENEEEIENVKNNPTALESQTKQVQLKTSNTRCRRKSSNARKDEDVTFKTIKSPSKQMETDEESTENTQSGELAKGSANSSVNNDVEKTTAVHKSKVSVSNNKEIGNSKDNWENEQNCSIRSLRQLRNRTKVIPQDPENFNKLKNNIEKESLQFRNRGKSDIIVRYDFDCSNRTRSVSLNLEPNGSDKLSTGVKKISRKPRSTDNYLEKTSRMIALRRRSAILENEMKFLPVSEENKRIQSKESLSSDTVECERSEIDSNQPKAVKDILDDSNSINTKISESSVIQKDDEMITSGSTLNEINSCDDDQNSNFSTETDLGKSNSSVKREKVIVVRKIKKGRRSKSIDDSAGTTHLQKTDDNSCNNTFENNLVQLETLKTEDNENPSEGSLNAKLNYTSTDSSNCQENTAVEETSLKIKCEKITPTKRGRTRANSVYSRGVTTETVQDDFNTNENNEKEMENTNESQDQEIIVNNFVTSNSRKVDEISETNPADTSNANGLGENVLEEDELKIKIEKVSPVKRGRRERSSKSILSNVDKEDSVTNNQKTDENVIVSKDNVDNSLENTLADQKVENALEETSLEIKEEKVSPVKKGRRGRRPKSLLSKDNTAIEKNKEVNRECIESAFDASEDILQKDNILTNHIVTSAEIHEHLENARISNVLDEKLKCDPDELSKAASTENNASAPNNSKSQSTKQGKRGRRPKSSRIDVSTKETEAIEDDSIISVVESTDLKEDNVEQTREVNKNSFAENPIHSDMENDTNIGDDNATHNSDWDTIDIDDKMEENLGKRLSTLRRRSSRDDKQESSAFDTQASCKDNVEKTKRRGRRSIKVQHEIVDSDDEPKNTVRKSGRRQRCNVNYCVPDEDVDVYDSEIEKKPFENAPKRRRGRPSKKEALLKLIEENSRYNQRQATPKDTTLDATVNDDDDSLSADVSSASTRKRSINEDIFEVESEPIKQEESLDIPDQSQAEAADDTNDFEDSHVSDKCEGEDIDEDIKPRRGRKRKYSFKMHGPRRRGRPPMKKKVQSNDDDYTPHHSYVPRPSKVKEQLNESPNKKLVKCGKCEKEVPRNQWYSHNLHSHNDMGWLDGTTKPDFDNDAKLLMRVLAAAHKKKHKKGLVCETCREVKRSVVGFISHVTFCGKTDEEIASLLVTCEQCGGKFKPSSMEYHERQHRLDIVGKKKKEKELAEKAIDIFEPRSKRKAAEKAVSKISEFTALVRDDDGCPAAKKLKLSSSHIKKFIQKPNATKKISSFLIAKWRRELDNKQDAACNQLGCQFTCKSMEEIREHYATCNYTVTENYVCKICRFQTLFEDEIVKHANEKHSSEDLDKNAAISDADTSGSDEDYSEIDEEDGSNKGKGLVKKFFYKDTFDVENKMFKFIFNNGACHTVINKTFLSGFQWTLEFERKHFKFSIFNDFTPNVFTLMEEKNAESYLPELDSSLPVRFVKKDGNLSKSEWKNWSRFNSARIDDCPTFFAGGPVWAMAWAPTPSYLAISDDLPQFLAVSTHPTMDIEYSVGEAYSGKNIIQIWNVGKLNNRNAVGSDPELSYAIAHDGGTVWSLEWCPSGCYQHEDFPDLKNENDTNRLGLLAAGCSDGCVRIYSLVFPQDLPDSPNENQYPIYKTEPVVQLIISSDKYENDEQNWQVMKLNWSRESNHNVIVAGLSNGYVALWDLTSESPMLKYKVNNTTFLRPCRQFFAHHHAVTMVALVPQDNKRYLATASLDKLYKFWDLEDISRPKNTYKKSYVTDGAWFNNWCCAVIVHDNALCSSGNNSAVCLPLRNYTYKSYNILPSNSTIYGVSTSDFGNSVATGNVAGELLAVFPHQLIYIRDMEKTIPPKRSCSLVSTTELVDFDAEQSGNAPVKRGKKSKTEPYSDPKQFMPSTYKDSKDRFGILFNNKIDPLKSNSISVLKYKKRPTLTCEHLEQTPVEQYPLKSINKVAWNPNASSFLWLAAGYQNGFVRLISFRSTASTAEWNKLLQSHTNSLKAQMDKTAAEDSC